MFHWICPECGREIPPAVKECFTCDPQAAPVPTPVLTAVAAPAVSEIPAVPAGSPPLPQLDPLLGLAQKLREIQEAQREQEVHREQGAQREIPQTPSVEVPVEGGAEIHVAAPAPAAEPEPIANPAPLLPGPLLLAAAPRALALLAPVDLPAPLELQPELPELPELATLPEPVSLSGLAEAVATAEPGTLAEEAAEETLTEDALKEETLTEEKPAPAEAATAAEPPPPIPTEVEPPAPSEAGRVRTPELALSPVAPSSALREDPYALPLPVAAPPMVERESALAPPALGLASLQDSSAIGNRIRPASSTAPILHTADSGPRVTLPGPALPKALNSLEDAGLSKILVDRPGHEKSGGRAWVTGGLAAVALLGAVLGMEIYNAPRSAASAPPAPATAHQPDPEQPAEASAAVSAVAPLPAPSPAATTSYSLAKAVEVTGLRFTEGKPEVRYLVVNHSPAALGAVTAYVTIRNSATKLPPSHFSFRVPALGPNESKEMVSSLDKALQATDWQNLRADVQLTQ